MLNGDAGFPPSFPSADPRGVGPAPAPNRSRPRLGRRLFLAGAAATALGGGGLAAAWMTRDDEPDVPQHLVLATGPKGAVYLQVGGDIAKAVEAYAPGTTIEVRSTAATVENLRLLGNRSADIAFASLDAAGSDSRVRQGIITGLCRVYDSYLHLVVLDGSPIRSPRDLEGKRVSIGGAGSGTEFTARLLLEVAGIAPAQLQTLGQTPSMKALEAGTIDAAFSLTGCPTPAISELAKRRPLRLIPVGEYFGALERSVPRAYAPAPIEDGAYQGVAGSDSVIVPNVLLARPDLPGAAVTMFMDALFDAKSQQYLVSADSKRISRDMATITGGATLHPAAKTWLEKHS